MKTTKNFKTITVKNEQHISKHFALNNSGIKTTIRTSKNPSSSIFTSLNNQINDCANKVVIKHSVGGSNIKADFMSQTTIYTQNAKYS